VSAVFIVLPLALLVVLGAVAAFAWAARRGQFDDLDTPALRMLHDDDEPRRGPKPGAGARESKEEPGGGRE
jgi:cbb3-type cytochrome oxidase maturation protein